MNFFGKFLGKEKNKQETTINFYSNFHLIFASRTSEIDLIKNLIEKNERRYSRLKERLFKIIL